MRDSRVNRDRRDVSFARSVIAQATKGHNASVEGAIMAKKAAAVPDVIDVPAVSEDEQFALEAGSTVQTFLAGLRGFFLQAQEMERHAKFTLEAARKLTVPTNSTDDEAVQLFVRDAATAKKAVEEHWGICQAVSGFHKRLTAARGRAVTALEEAGTISNRLHNQYTEAARRRAAEEQERVRREAEQKARDDRQRELDAAEADAAKAEEASPDLSERETTFVEMYVSTGNGERAAKVAGYKNALTAGAKLLLQPKIQTAIKAKQEAAAIRSQAAAKAAAPLEVEVETVRPDITRAAGTRGDVTTWGYEVLDEEAFVRAVVKGGMGIPLDCLQINRSKLGEYSRSLHERLDLWPGVRHTKKTGVR